MRRRLAQSWILAVWSVASAVAIAQTPVPAVKSSPASPGISPATPSGNLSGWNALNPAQKQSLLPLATSWGTLTESQRRKWLALTKNFASMSPADQATLHSRMTEWAALSPQQRSRARLNFGETRQLPPTEKKAQWEAYQALSPEEKRRLAESRNTNSAGTATALKPVPPQKQVHVPEVTAHRQNAPTVVIPTPLVNQKTLLPRKTAPAASTPARNP